MPDNKLKSKKPLVAALIAAAVVVLGVLAIILIFITSDQAPTVTIEYADQQKSAKITLDGKTEDVDVPTVEKIESNKQFTKSDDPDVGQGAWHDISSPEAYKNSVLGACTDVDGYYGSQCFDLASDFWHNYTGRWVSSCGTGAAYGIADCWQQNAGDEFEMIWNARDIQPGDWIILNTGEFGHVGQAMGYYNNGYVTLLGQNQGGTPCPGGGSSANIININLATFKAAFRPKIYIKPAPEPEPAPAPDPLPSCPVGSEITLVKGNTLGQIKLACTGELNWSDGSIYEYATQWISTQVKPGQVVLDGWNTYPGIGLWAGDTIRRIK